MKWTQERCETAQRLWRDGVSASKIAHRLGGVSRSAVIGRMHRKLGPKDVQSAAKARAIAGKLKAAADKARQPRAAKPANHRPGKPYVMRQRFGTREERDASRVEWVKIQQRLASIPEVVRVTSIIDLEPHHCRWPIGEPTRGFCGCQKQPGTSYCAKHLIRAHAGKDLARVYANMAGAHIDMHVFGLEKLAKEHAAA